MSNAERMAHFREDVASLSLPLGARWVVYAERGAELLAAARLARKRAARREAEERGAARYRAHGAAWLRASAETRAAQAARARATRPPAA